MREPTFVPGDTVYLKSGSPALMVTEVISARDGWSAKCIWMDAQKNLVSADFNQVCLTAEVRPEQQ